MNILRSVMAIVMMAHDAFVLDPEADDPYIQEKRMR
jgi:hypothetical protein